MSAQDRFSYSSAPVRRIKGIQFGILDPDFIVRRFLSRRVPVSACFPRGGSTFPRSLTGTPPYANPQRRYSVAKIDTAQIYDKGRPRMGGTSF